MKAAAYLRVSSDEQVARNSIQTQREAVQAFAAREGIQIVAEYTDEGVSGTVALADRPGGARLLNDAAGFEAVVFYAVDRLGRDTVDTAIAMRALQARGPVLRSATQSLESQLLTDILLAIGAEERRGIIRRTQAGVMRRVKAGAWMGGPVPYGYRKQGEPGHYTLRPCEAEVAPGLTEAGVVRRIFAWVIEGKSCQTIADLLNGMGTSPSARPSDGSDRGVRRAKPSTWHAARVWHVIQQPLYKGVHVYKTRTETIERDGFPALVTPAEWQLANTRSTANRRAGNGNETRCYLLKSLVRCAQCGASYVGQRYKDRRGVERSYYKPASSRVAIERQGNCPHKAIRAGEIESAVWSDVEAVLANPVQILASLREHLGGTVEARVALEDEQREIKRRLTDKDAERANLVRLAARGLVDDAELETATEAYRTERKALETYLADLEARIVSQEELANRSREVEGLLKGYRKNLKAAGLDRRAVLKELVEGVAVDGERVQIVYRFAAPVESAAPAVDAPLQTAKRSRSPICRAGKWSPSAKRRSPSATA